MSKKYRYIEEDVNYHFLSFVKEIFESHFSKIEPDTTIENFCSNLSDDQKEKLFKTSFFYYHRGWKLMKQKNWFDNFDESFIFIILISIAEAIVSAEDYVEFINWYPKNHQEMKTFNEEKEIYLNKFGVKRKFDLFINEYIIKEDRNTLMKNINIWNESTKAFKSLDSVSELSKLFYDLRSGFVHNAQYISFFVQSGWAVCGHKNNAYSIKIDFPTIVPIFERGFLNYFIKNK
ncbi:MAG: hypothetical protein WA063_05645 [Minisyncoccia bacterium]